MLRTYLDGDDLRLNIWDNRYAVDNYSAIHDHPWRFVSCIYAGRLLNQRYVLDPTGGECKAVLIRPGEGGGPTEDPHTVYLRPQRIEIYNAGAFYGQTAKELHRTMFDDGTVTVIERERVVEQDVALSIWQGDGDWVSAEPRPATPDEIEAIISYALRRF